MSLFKKRKNLNIKPRRVDDDDEENEENQIEASFAEIGLSLNRSKPNPPQILGPTEIYFGKKEKKRSKDKITEKKLNVLSFEDELEADDGIVFQEKKSKQSYKLRRELKKERKEKKKEERDKSKVSNGRNVSKEKSAFSVSDLDDLGIKIVNGREAEAIAHVPGDSDESDNNGAPVFRPRNSEANAWKDALQSGKIPDANLIHRIRKERQKARERDFIPLDDTVRAEDCNSRLIREDDNDRSDDEENRITFAINLEEADRKKRKEVFEAAQDDEEQDQEVEWEMQQIKNAGASVKMTNADPNIGYDVIASSYSTMPTESILAESTSLHVGLSRPENYQTEGILKRFRESHVSVQEVHQRHRMEAESIMDDLLASKTVIARCNVERDPQTELFRFYQDMRGYVTDLRECLDQKLVDIKKLEEQVYLDMRRQSQKLTQRRRQDVKDQNNEFSPFTGKLPKADDYRMRRSAEREGRRTRRRREREKKGDTKHHDGMSTDDEESQSDSNRVKNDMASMEAKRVQVFEDVEDDFAQLNMIMKRFENWKSIDTPSYNDAYVSYNLPKIFAPLIRLEMILWNPLDKGKEMIEVERLQWFSKLVFYGVQIGDQTTVESFKVDTDKNLISHIIEKVILPKIKDIVCCYWDPLSHTQSVRLVNLIRHYTSYPSLSPNSKQLKDVTLAIIDKIRDCIENDVFIPMFPKNVYESRTSGVSLFFQRQFWSSWKLLGSVLMWHRILNHSVIQELAIRSLLNLYLIPALNLTTEINVKDALHKARNVINVLPKEWSKLEEGTHTFLTRLEVFLVSLAGKLDSVIHESDIKEICDLLKSIGARPQAHVLANKYL